MPNCTSMSIKRKCVKLHLLTFHCSNIQSIFSLSIWIDCCQICPACQIFCSVLTRINNQTINTDLLHILLCIFNPASGSNTYFMQQQVGYSFSHLPHYGGCSIYSAKVVVSSPKRYIVVSYVGCWETVKYIYSDWSHVSGIMNINT